MQASVGLQTLVLRTLSEGKHGDFSLVLPKFAFTTIHNEQLTLRSKFVYADRQWNTKKVFKNLYVLNVTTVTKCQNLKVIQRIYLKHVNSENHVLKWIHKLQ